MSTPPGGGAKRVVDHSLLLEHARALRASLDQMRSNLATSIVGVAVMAVAIALPAMIYVLVRDQQALLGQWGGSPSLTVFLRKDAEPQAVAALRQRLGSDIDVNDVEFIDAARAFQEFARAAGLLGGELAGENPLPDIVIVKLTAAAWNRDRGAALVERLEADGAVDMVSVDVAWVERLAALGALAERLVYVLAVVLAAGVLLMVGVTVRMLVIQQAEEIDVQKLVGATDAFVRRPFLYEGLLHGIAAGLLAVALADGALAALGQPVARLAAAYASAFAISGIGFGRALALVALAALLGWCGAWIGAAHSLRRLQPPGI